MVSWFQGRAISLSAESFVYICKFGVFYIVVFKVLTHPFWGLNSCNGFILKSLSWFYYCCIAFQFWDIITFFLNVFFVQCYFSCLSI